MSKGGEAREKRRVRNEGEWEERKDKFKNDKSEEQIGDRRNKTEKFREAIIVGVKRQNDRNEKK